MGRYLLLFAALVCAFIGHARGQGLDPPGRLGVSPADAEKCDGFKRQDFQALLYGANKLSVSSYVLGQPVLPAAQEPSAQDAKDCAVGSTWNQLEMQLHAALSPPAYITDDRKLNPLRASFFPTIRDQVTQGAASQPAAVVFIHHGRMQPPPLCVCSQKHWPCSGK